MTQDPHTPARSRGERRRPALALTTFSLVTLWSAVSVAQRVPVDDVHDASSGGAQEVVVEEYEEPARETPRGELLFAPTFAAHVGFSNRYMVDGSTRKNTHLALYGGLSGNMVLNRHVLSFLGGGVEVEHHKLDEHRNVTYFMPMFQAGMSFVGCHEHVGVLAAMFPCARVYGMAGYRPAPPNRSGSLRLGVGASSLWLTGIAASAEFLLPSHYEFITELDGHGNRLLMFRVGLGF